MRALFRQDVTRKPLLRERWLNAQHPMNRGLMFWYLFNEGGGGNGTPVDSGPPTAWDIAGKTPPISFVVGTQNTPRVTVWNEEVALTQLAYNDYWTLPNITAVNDFTFIWTGGFPSTAVTFRTLFTYYYEPVNTYLVCYYSHNSYANGPMWSCTINGGAAPVSGFAMTAGVKYVLALVRSGTTLTFYKNAVDVGGSGTSGSGAATFTNGYIGQINIYGQYGNTYTSSVQCFNRALSVSELFAHNLQPYGTEDNPRLLVRPYRSRYGTTVPAFKSAWLANSNVLIQPGIRPC